METVVLVRSTGEQGQTIAYQIYNYKEHHENIVYWSIHDDSGQPEDKWMCIYWLVCVYLLLNLIYYSYYGVRQVEVLNAKGLTMSTSLSTDTVCAISQIRSSKLVYMYEVCVCHSTCRGLVADKTNYGKIKLQKLQMNCYL